MQCLIAHMVKLKCYILSKITNMTLNGGKIEVFQLKIMLDMITKLHFYNNNPNFYK